ncbi:MAG: biopolymer transporter ExbD [Opitutales bacterium]|nr:biopolymer transporter ExbD [Opitutales bacterium]
MASSGGGNGEPEFQIAPMLDVLFVLLIFFMSISTSQMLKIDTSITLPVASNGAEPDQKTKAKAVLINVSWDKTLGQPIVKLDDTLIDITEQGRDKAVEMIISRATNPYTKEIDPEVRFLIRADRQIPAKYISRVLMLAADAGMDNIAFTGMSKDD